MGWGRRSIHSSTYLRQAVDTASRKPALVQIRHALPSRSSSAEDGASNPTGSLISVCGLLKRFDRFLYQTNRLASHSDRILVYFLKLENPYCRISMGGGLCTQPVQKPFYRSLGQYIFWNWLGPFLAWLLHIHNRTSFMYFHLCFAIAFTLAFLYYVFSTFAEGDARTALVLFLSVGYFEPWAITGSDGPSLSL